MRYVELGDVFEKGQANLEKQINTIPDRNKRAHQKALAKSKIETLKKAENELSEGFSKNLEYVIKELYQNQFLFQIILEDAVEISMFSASLNRDNLKEDVLQLLHKYGRQTEKEFYYVRHINSVW